MIISKISQLIIKLSFVLAITLPVQAKARFTMPDFIPLNTGCSVDEIQKQLDKANSDTAAMKKAKNDIAASLSSMSGIPIDASTISIASKALESFEGTQAKGAAIETAISSQSIKDKNGLDVIPVSVLMHVIYGNSCDDIAAFQFIGKLLDEDGSIVSMSFSVDAKTQHGAVTIDGVTAEF